MPEKKLKIDDSIDIEKHGHLRYDAAGEQRQLDEKFYTREKSILETSAVYLIIGIGTLIGLFIFFRIQSFHVTRGKEMKAEYEKQQQNEKQKHSYIAEVNALRNSVSELKNTDIVKYASTEINEAENIVLESETELKKYNFVKVKELIQKTKDKLDMASNKAKRITEENKEKELAKKKAQEEKEKKELEKQKQREEALRKLQELEKIIKH